MENAAHERALIRRELLRIQGELHSRQDKVLWQTERLLGEEERAANVRRAAIGLTAAGVLGTVSMAGVAVFRFTVGEPFLLTAALAGVWLLVQLYSVPKAVAGVRQRTHERLRLELDTRRQKLTVTDMAGRRTVYRFRQQNVLLPPFPIAAGEADLQRLAEEVQQEISRISGLEFAERAHQAA